jgi:hypothetical protein
VTEAPLHALVDRAIESYCRFLSFEYSHLESWKQQEWLRRRAEAISEHKMSNDKRWAIMKYLFRAGACNQSDAFDCTVDSFVHRDEPVQACLSVSWTRSSQHQSVLG